MEKQCAECGEIKPLTEFWKNCTTSDGYQRRCIPCQKVAVRRTLEKQDGKTGSVEMICQHCGKTYRERPSRVQRSKYCSVECRNLDKTTLPMIPCQVCGKPIRQDKSHRRYCSTACRAIDRTTAVTLTCPVCGKTYQIYRKAAATRKFCSEGCQAIASRTQVERTCERCGKVFKVKPSVLAKKGARFCSMRCANGSIAWGGETSLERTVREALEVLGITYQAQYDILRYDIDFYLPDFRVALEADGEYWHNKRPDHFRRRDVRLLALGITTIRITDVELTGTSPVEVVRNKLQSYL